MKTITIRDLRRRWSEIEGVLEVEKEIFIMRDSKPVAKLVSITSSETRRPRWNVGEHARWQKKLARGKISCSNSALAQDLADRVFAAGQHK